MTELPALTGNRGTTLLHRSGHYYQLHQPHLAIPTSQSQPILYNSGNAAHYMSGTASLPTFPQGLPRHPSGQGNRESVAASTHISCLYPEILALIFSYLEVRDKGRAAQVCVAWRDAAYHRSVWRGVEAKLHLRKQAPALFASLVKRGVKRVQVLSLRRGLGDVLKGVPNLESLNLSGCYNVNDLALMKAFSQEYTTLTELNLSLCKQVSDISLSWIAKYLQNLEHLELSGCRNITNDGLLCIAWYLKKLKKLELRSCWQVCNDGIAYLAGIHPHTPTSFLMEQLAGIVDIDAAGGNFALEQLNLQDC